MRGRDAVSYWIWTFSVTHVSWRQKWICSKTSYSHIFVRTEGLPWVACFCHPVSRCNIWRIWVFFSSLDSHLNAFCHPLVWLFNLVEAHGKECPCCRFSFLLPTAFAHAHTSVEKCRGMRMHSCVLIMLNSWYTYVVDKPLWWGFLQSHMPFRTRYPLVSTSLIKWSSCKKQKADAFCKIIVICAEDRRAPHVTREILGGWARHLSFSLKGKAF